MFRSNLIVEKYFPFNSCENGTGKDGVRMSRKTKSSGAAVELSLVLVDRGAGKLRQECNVYRHRVSTTPKPGRGEMFSEHCAPWVVEMNGSG